MSYARDGFVVAPIFKPEDVIALRGVVADHMNRVSRALYAPAEDTAPHAGYDERIEQIAPRDPSYAQLLAAAVATDAHRGAAAAALAEDRRLTEAVEQIIGARIAGRTVRFRGNSSAMSQHRQHWHSDVATLDGEACAKVRLAAWIPLMDAGPETGGLEMACGLRDTPLPHDAVPGKFNIPDSLLEDAPKAQPLVPVGSCLLMDRFTPHRALPNRSGKTRWSLVVWMRA